MLKGHVRLLASALDGMDAERWLRHGRTAQGCSRPSRHMPAHGLYTLKEN